LPLQARNEHTGLMRPVTKWSYSIGQTARIPEFVAMAFRHAVSGRPGPVFLEIPIDVLFARVDEEAVKFPENYRPQTRPGPSREALAQTLQWLTEAQRPAILAG